MAAKTTYRIDDEPQPGTLAKAAVDPLWPLLGLMFAGAWLSWPWFALNSFAVGSPTRHREVAWVIGGFAVSALLLGGIFHAIDQGVIPKDHISYALLALTVWKLWVGYVLYTLQSRTTHIYEYYGGVLQNGLVVLLVAAFVGRPQIMQVLDNPFIRLLLN